MKLGQKSVKKLVGFLGDLETPKFHSEINRPLAQLQNEDKAFFMTHLHVTHISYLCTRMFVYVRDHSFITSAKDWVGDLLTISEH